MAVTYSAEVATTQNTVSVFFKLMFRCRGSLYRVVWRDLTLFCLLYALLSCLYRFGPEGMCKECFENLVRSLEPVGSAFPLAFILGFFVSSIMKHRQDAFNNIPNLDNYAINVNVAIKGEGEAQRLRKQLVRYGNLAFALTMSSISPQMKKRLPTWRHFVETGILSEEECKTLQELEELKRPTHWVPFVWAANLLFKANAEGLLANDKVIYEVMKELNKLKINCENLMNYDTLTIPLVYTQVVTLAVYGYAATAVIGQQFVAPRKTDKVPRVDYYVPVFTLIQFVIYFGWMRVAETMMNSMGEDDDDFDINAIFDRNCEVTQYIVTDMHAVCPRKTEDDPYFEEELPPFPIPHTLASKNLQKRANAGSFQNFNVSIKKRKLLVKRRRDDSVDFDLTQVYTFDIEGQQKKLCSQFCSCCRNSDSDYDTGELEAISVEDMEQTRKRRRDRLRRRKNSES